MIPVYQHRLFVRFKTDNIYYQLKQNYDFSEKTILKAFITEQKSGAKK